MSENEKKETFAGLARKLGRLPAAKRKVALEVGASLAAVSLKVSREFVEAVPRASKLLPESNLRDWGELGRKLAMSDISKGADFFSKGTRHLEGLTEKARGYLFEICVRQTILSSSVAVDTFETAPKLAKTTEDKTLVESVFRIAADVAGRSAKHSAEFLRESEPVIRALNGVGERQADAIGAVMELAGSFAARTGGMTADLWKEIPGIIEGLSTPQIIRLSQFADGLLKFGGSVTLHFVNAAKIVLKSFDEVFGLWADVAEKFGRHGNSVLIAFLRYSPEFFASISSIRKSREAHSVAEKVLNLVSEIAEVDAESALAAFRSSAGALNKVSLAQFAEWVEAGMKTGTEGSSKARRSYFALETRRSNEVLEESADGLSLEQISNVLRIYVEGLTGREIEIAPLAALPSESRIGDGKTIYLPSKIDEFGTEEMDFRLYKVLSAHGAGQIEFGTFARNTTALQSAFTELRERFEMTAEQFDAFSLAGYIEEVQKGEAALPESEFREMLRKRFDEIPKEIDFHTVLKVFPEPRLAKRIFGTMENARIDKTLRRTYKGLQKDLDLMQAFLRERRPYIFDLPIEQVPAELLFQITLCGGATEDARRFYGQIVSEIESVIEQSFHEEGATVADSLIAAARVYSLFQNIAPQETQAEETEEKQEEGEYTDSQSGGEAATESQQKKQENRREAEDVRDMFNAWSRLEEEEDRKPRDVSGTEAWALNEIPEQPLELGDEAFLYDEWDRELADFRTGWCRVVEKRVRQGDRNFVELARSRYKGVISSVRHQFQLMKPENLTRINRELDGEEYDLNAVVDYVIDKRADGRPEERLYQKRLRRERDVAVSLLLDQSSSTARTITRNPLQPYTHPGRRIIEIEKEGLVLMSEALEAVGDIYSINGFTSEGRRNVKFYVVKEFGEKYSEEVEKRIGGITFQNNTRLGAAIRHAAAKLLRQESRTKLMIILTDGRPYDHDYGDAKYAKEDVREALTDAKMLGITPFCITIDRDSEQELRDLYGEVGYTIIDDVLSLPEKLPNIYRRLTS
ncbi:MAG: VWA domain-containing protein [Pyrinomonadaceae bacterium]